MRRADFSLSYFPTGGGFSNTAWTRRAVEESKSCITWWNLVKSCVIGGVCVLKDASKRINHALAFVCQYYGALNATADTDETVVVLACVA